MKTYICLSLCVTKIGCPQSCKKSAIQTKFEGEIIFFGGQGGGDGHRYLLIIEEKNM